MGKMSLPQTVYRYFTISNFLYKLTQPNIHGAAAPKEGVHGAG